MLERKLKRTGIRRGLERIRSKRYSPVDSKCFIAAIDSGESLGFMRIYLMPLADQSVLKKVGFKLSYRRRG